MLAPANLPFQQNIINLEVLLFTMQIDDEIFDVELDMKPVREKLLNLQLDLPDEKREVYEYGRFLSHMLLEKESIASFCARCRFAIEELIAGWNAKEIVSSLAPGDQSWVYEVDLRLPDIIEVALPHVKAEARKFYIDSFIDPKMRAMFDQTTVYKM
jgi:hypothetical protein